MNMLWNSPVALAIATAVACLVAVLLFRAGLIYGTTGTGVCIGSGISLIIFGMLENLYDIPDFGTNSGFIRALLGGLLLSVGFRFALRAFALYGIKR